MGDRSLAVLPSGFGADLRAELMERVEAFTGEEIDLETMSTPRSFLDLVGGSTEASP